MSGRRGRFLLLNTGRKRLRGAKGARATSWGRRASAQPPPLKGICQVWLLGTSGETCNWGRGEEKPSAPETCFLRTRVKRLPIHQSGEEADPPLATGRKQHKLFLSRLSWVKEVGAKILKVALYKKKKKKKKEEQSKSRRYKKKNKKHVCHLQKSGVESFPIRDHQNLLR